jgi:hypothetical protein
LSFFPFVFHEFVEISFLLLIHLHLLGIKGSLVLLSCLHRYILSLPKQANLPSMVNSVFLIVS